MNRLVSYFPAPNHLQLEARLTFLAPGKIEVQFSWPKEWPFKCAENNSAIVGERKNNLWQTTCFEFFIRRLNSPLYWEANISPQGDWNLYTFQDYRTPQPPTPLVMAKMTSFHFEPGNLLAKFELPVEFSNGFEYSLNAIIESHDGQKNYWALAHSTAKPDFHDFRNFKKGH